MSAVLSRPQFDAPAALQAVLENYPVGELQACEFATNGIENLNYFITTEQGADSATADVPARSRTRQFVATFLLHPPHAGEAYADMMDALAGAGLPVANPVRNLSGAALDQYAQTPVLLQRHIDGRHTVNPTIRQLTSLGRFIAYMHISMRRTGIELPTYPRDLAWLSAHAESVQTHLPFAAGELVRDTCTRVASLLQRSDTNSLPQGMIHGDLFRDNVLFNERGLTGVLDFHHAARGYWIYDLAVAANDWCSDSSGTLDKDRTTALLRAYHSVRPLQQAEVWLFPAFGLYAGLVFWLSRLADWVPHKSPGIGSDAQGDAQQDAQGDAQQDAPRRTKNPDEMKAIVQQHTRHQFYLDLRLLD